MKLIITMNDINFIGGIETWLYNMTSQLSNEYDILILYETADDGQLTRLSSYANMKKIVKNHVYECDICIFASTYTPYYNNINAIRYIQIIHSDFVNLGYSYKPRDIKNLEYVSVTKLCKDGLKQTLHINSKVIGNPLGIPHEPERVLHLLSCTRLSLEKGYERMKVLAKALKDIHIPFEWKIFSDTEFYNVDKMDYPEVVYYKPTFDITRYICEADYGVQLSDTESYGYFIHECLQYFTPVLVTNLPCLKETEFTEGVHGYKLEFDMSNLDVNKIYNQCPSFSKQFKEPDSIGDWKKFLGKSDTPTKIEDSAKIKANVSFFDLHLNKEIKEGTIYEVPSYRANYLCNKTICKKGGAKIKMCSYVL